MRELFIRKLVRLVEQSDIDSLQVKSWGRSVRIVKTRPAHNGSAPPLAPLSPSTRVIAATTEPSTSSVPLTGGAEVPSAKPAEPAAGTHEIKSPMVGTFYRAPSPDSKPYTEVGDKVKQGQTVCIVEAMKLMNEIESDVAGTVTEILVENGQPVEYGQVLFVIKTG
jgi:acetyl-CoA carboxylase biotin carboxyl carrier protein